MKVIEKINCKGNFDSKNILNRSEAKIDLQLIEHIENNGVTSEFLDTIGVPVFKYRTQITIHGIFPDIGSVYVNGYKNIFQNKNKSVGVQYNAIDGGKKKKIYDTICAYSNFRLMHNSTDFYIYLTSKRFSSKTEYTSYLELINAEIEHINKDLFFGSTGVNLYQDMGGTYFLAAYISIDAIYEKNITALIENICKADIDSVYKVIAEKKEKQENERKERAAQWEREKNDQIEAERPLRELALKMVSDCTKINKVENIAIYDGLEVLKSISVNVEKNEIYFHFRKYYKETRQKKFRYTEKTYLNETPAKVEFSKNSYMDSQTSLTNIKQAFVLTNAIEAEIEPVNTAEERANDVHDVQVVNYSDKSFAVVGNTKPIKDKLLSLGGRFNFRLTCGAGWIFPLSKLPYVKQTLCL
jgi:hypothetical protein